MRQQDSCVAVITGDIIGSRRLGVNLWMPKLKSVLSELGNKPGEWDIFRGDAFQVLVEEPSEALNMAMKIKSGLKITKGLDARMAIGLGDISYRAVKVSESSGEAFVCSGALIDELEQRHTNLALKSANPDFDEDLNVSLSLAAALMDRWLPSYAEAMAWFLRHPHLTQQELGGKMGIAQNTLSERQTRGFRRELVALDRLFRRQVSKYIEQLGLY